MNEQFMQQLFAELIESTGQSIALLTLALSKQINAEQLADDLRDAIKHAGAQAGTGSLTERIAKHALDAATAQAKIQRGGKAH